MAKNNSEYNAVEIQKPVTQLQKYSLEEFCENSKELFNVNFEVIIGATHECKDKEFTIEQMKELITKFLTRKVGK